MVSTPALSGELLPLAEFQFNCKKGELRLHNEKGSRRYPAGKQEKVRISTKTGILSYTCRYKRYSIICPIDTTLVTVKRVGYPGKFAVECLGDPGLGSTGQDTNKLQGSDSDPTT